MFSHSARVRPAVVLSRERVHLLVDRGVEEHGQHDGRRAVDGHGDRRVGCAELEAAIEHLDVVQGADADPRGAHLAVDVGPDVRVEAVEGDRVEGGRQALGLVVGREHLEAPVGARRVALAGEHARGVLIRPLEREDAGGEREAAGDVFRAHPAVDLGRILEPGQDDLGDAGVRKGLRVERQPDLALTDHVDQLIRAIEILDLAPLRHDPARLGGERLRGRAGFLPEPCEQLRGLARERLGRLLEVPAAPQGLHLLPGLAMIAPDRLGDLAQVADPLGRNDDGLRGGCLAGGPRQARFEADPGLGGDGVDQGVVEGRHPVIVELGGDGAEDRHLLGPPAKGLAVALDLLAHVLHGVVAAALLELVDHRQVGEIQHVDFLELRGGPVLTRHDIDGHVHEVDDARVALADAGGFRDDKIKTRRLDGHDGVGQGFGYLCSGAARGKRAHVDPRTADGVHADAVPQERPTGFAARRVAAQHRHPRLPEVVQDAHDQLIGQGGLARAAGAGDADNRHPAAADLRRKLRPQPGQVAVLKRLGHLGGRDQVGHQVLVVRRERIEREIEAAHGGEVQLPNQVVDHALQPQAGAIFGRVDLGDAIGFEFPDFLRHDHPSPAAEDLDVGNAALAQQVDQVFEEFDVAALVARNGHPLDVLLDGRVHDLLHGAVVAEMDHLDPGVLNDPAHDVDGRVVSVEDRGGRHQPDGVLGFVDFDESVHAASLL